MERSTSQITSFRKCLSARARTHNSEKSSCPYNVCQQFWGRKWVRQFYGRLEFLLSFGRKTSMSLKFLALGGVFCFFWGGRADIIFVGAEIFLNNSLAQVLGSQNPCRFTKSDSKGIGAHVVSNCYTVILEKASQYLSSRHPAKCRLSLNQPACLFWTHGHARLQSSFSFTVTWWLFA